MCLPWNHKWKTIEQWQGRIWNNPNDALPTYIEKYIQQQCEHCGKEIVRRYRV